MGGLWKLRFSATKAWSAVPADPVHAEWYRIEPAEGDNGNGTVKVTVLPNITTEKRSAEIIIRSGRAEQRLSFAHLHPSWARLKQGSVPVWHYK